MGSPSTFNRHENDLLTADCHPITVVPGLHRLFLEYCSGSRRRVPFYSASLPPTRAGSSVPASARALAGTGRLLAAQNPSPSPAAASALEALRGGAGVVVTGQQVGLFGGPLFTPIQSRHGHGPRPPSHSSGHPHQAIFWLATEDHDFAEINHVTFPAGRALRKMVYVLAGEPSAARPVGGLVLDDRITPLVERAAGVARPFDAMDALASPPTSPAAPSPRPSPISIRRSSPPRACWFSTPAAATSTASARPSCARPSSAPTSCTAALLDRNRELEAAGYHAQVAVTEQSSLLFLIDAETGARLALKRSAPTAGGNRRPLAGRQAKLFHRRSGRHSRFRARAHLPLSASAPRLSGFPALHFALHRRTGRDRLLRPIRSPLRAHSRPPNHASPARFFGTLIEPAIAKLLRRHELTLERVFTETPESLAQLLAARSMPVETKQKLAAAGNALDAELTPSSNGCARRTRAWASRPKPPRARSATR
jgi:hypothetical protein